MCEKAEIIDKLGRYDFIKFIENLILKSDKYKRDSNYNSYVMALNSAWGTGKSYFIDLLIQEINKSDDICTVRYNAWENDYCDNAFNPLIYDILNSDCMEYIMKSDADKKNIVSMLKGIFKVGVALTKDSVVGFIENKFNTNIEATVNSMVETGGQLKNFMLCNAAPNLKKLNEQREAFNEFKSCLSKVTEYMKYHNKKLFVIVDELDRCKPTFAIQTLEIVKHIFDVENIVFLFAVDIEQLGHSISCVYGQGFDSVGYLCRFFDYIAKMPVPDIKCYVENSLAEVDALKDRTVKSYREEYKNCLLIEDIAEYFNLLYNDFSLSLRDFDTILKNYIIMFDNFLGRYKLSLSHIIYLFFLTLKYKKPKIFDEIFVNKATNNIKDMANIMYEYKSVSETPVKNAAEKAINKIPLSELYEPICSVTGDNIGKFITIVNVKNGKIIYKESTCAYDIGEDENYGNLLFEQDFYKWEQIKNYTYAEFIHKQLENYNFTEYKADEVIQ